MDSSNQLVPWTTKKILTVGSYVVAGVLLFFIVVASSETLSDMLGFSWLQALHHEEEGVYADCSKRENKDKPFCQPKTSEQDRDWRDLFHSKGGATHPFSLHND